MPNTYSNIPEEDRLPTPFEYALMCNAAYFDGNPAADANFSKGISPDWKKLTWSMPNDHGYVGIVYRNDNTKHIVIVHRGTSPDLIGKNLHTDLYLTGYNVLPDYIQSTSIAFSQSVRQYNPGMTFSETGHSLGGMLAQINGDKFKETEEIISFDSPGCGRLIKNDNGVKFITYLSAPNMFNTSVKEHIGTVYRIYIYHYDLAVSKKNLTPAYSATYSLGEFTVAYANVGLSFYFATKMFGTIPKVGELCSSYDIRQHAMSNIIRAFDEHTGQPLLQREVLEWPSLRSYIFSKFDFDAYVYTGIFKNLLAERALSWSHDGTYSVGKFVTPNLTTYPDSRYVMEYKRESLVQFDSFYYNEYLRNEFITQLSLPFSQSLQSAHYPKLVKWDAEFCQYMIKQILFNEIDQRLYIFKEWNALLHQDNKRDSSLAVSHIPFLLTNVRKFLLLNADPHCCFTFISERCCSPWLNMIGDVTPLFFNLLPSKITKIPLIQAAIAKEIIPLVRLLCRHGLAINQPHEGLTPLQFAAIRFSKDPENKVLEEIIIGLCRYGADMNCTITLSETVIQGVTLWSQSSIFESYKEPLRYRGKSALDILAPHIAPEKLLNLQCKPVYLETVKTELVKNLLKFGVFSFQKPSAIREQQQNVTNLILEYLDTGPS